MPRRTCVFLVAPPPRKDREAAFDGICDPHNVDGGFGVIKYDCVQGDIMAVLMAVTAMRFAALAMVRRIFRARQPKRGLNAQEGVK